MLDQDIKYAITADNRFSATFAQLKRDIGGLGSQFDGVLNKSRLLGAALGAVGVAASGAGFRQLVNDLDAFNDAADATGASVEKLSALEDVARRNGESLDTVVTAALKLNKVLSDTSADNATAKQLRRLGLDAAELRRLDPADAVLKLGRALDGAADDGDKARLVLDIFSKSTRELAPFLKDLAQAGEVNAKVTAQQAEEAERFSKALNAMKTEAGNAARGLVSELLPALNEGLLMFQRLRQGPGLGAGIAEVFKGNSFTTAQAGLDHYRTELARLDKDLQEFSSGKRRRFGLYGRDFLADTEKARAKTAEFLAVYRDLLNAGSAGGGRGTGLQAPKVALGPGAPDKGTSGAGAPRVSEAERYLEALQKQGEKLQDLNTYEQLLADISNKRVDGLTPKLEKELKLAAKQVDAKRDLIAQQEKQLELDKKIAEQEAAFNRVITDKSQRDIDDALGLLAQTNTGRLKALEEQADKLLALGRKIPDDDPRQRQISEAMAKLRKEVDDIANPTDKAAGEFDKLANAIEKSMDRATDAVLDFVVDGKGSIGDLFKAFERDLLRALIEEPIRDVMRSVAKIVADTFKGGGSSGGVGNLLDIIFGKGIGGTGGFDLGSLFGFGGGGTSRALGGGVNAGQLVRWNENGREYFVPDTAGQVLTQQQMRSATGGGLQQVNHFNISGGNPEEVARLVDARLQANNAQLLRARRLGHF